MKTGLMIENLMIENLDWKPFGEKGKKNSCTKIFLNLLGNIGETVAMLKDLI